MSKFLFGCSFLLLVLLFITNVHAQKPEPSSQMITSEVKVLDTKNQTISATASFTNKTNKNYAKSYISSRLISPNGNTIVTTPTGQQITLDTPGQLVGYSKSDFFPLLSGEVVSHSISLKYPSAITSGTYTLLVELHDQVGSSQSVTSKEIELSGTDSFLEISEQNCTLKVNDITYSLMEGPNIGKNETGLLTCTINNTTGKSVTAKTQVSYAINSVLQDKGKVSVINSSNQVTIASGEKGVVTVTVPKNLTPQVYEGLLVLLNSSNEEISANVPFRWIITGSSAIINNLALDKSFYTKGDNAQVSLSILPSMDLSWRGGTTASNSGYTPNAGTDLKEPHVVVKIFDSNKQLCGQKDAQLPSTQKEIYWEDITLAISVDKECLNPSVEAAVYEEGIDEPLAIANKELLTNGASSQGIQKKMLWIGLGMVLLSSIIIGGIYMKKKHNVPPSTPVSPDSSGGKVLIIFLFGILSLFPLKQTYAQTFSPIQGTSKPYVNSTDVNTQTTTQKKFHDRVVGGPNPLQWANVRDFAENNTGGDSKVKVSADCKTIEVTVNGTASSDYMCANWGPGIAIANFVDGQPVTPSAVSSALRNLVVIPSLQIVPSAFNNKESYGPHIVNVYNTGTIEPKSVTYTLNFPNGLSDGTHKLLLQAGVSQTTTHGSIDRFYSSLEPVTDGPGQRPDFNCDGEKRPCYTPLEYTFTCGPPPACNTKCLSSDYCKNALDGCTQCVPSTASGSAGMTCQPPPTPTPTLSPTPVLTCNKTCETSTECARGGDGCPVCLPNAQGAKVCQPVPACNSQCFSSDYCKGASNGCTTCSGGTCKAPACNLECSNNFDCEGAKDGCTVCRADEDQGGKKVCQPKFSDKMCKCDGMDFTTAKGTTFFPGDDVTFIAFGKVQGQDIDVADITSMTFSLYHSTLADPNKATRLAQSTAITPEVVSNTADKVRYKVTWNQKIPSTVPSGSLYRVQATIKCSPKPGVLGAQTGISPSYYESLITIIQGIFKNTKTVLGEGTEDNQQAKSFFPGAKISEKSCSIIKYYFD